jgi:acetyl esterase/lipase
LDNFKTVDYAVSSHNYNQSQLLNYTPTEEASKCLILHAHGGGFIAHSSRSHEIYLRPWCKELKIPLVSIDYSLSPEHIFPKASEECFYVYAWCLLNKEALGWTGERIVCVGDSAGGVLVTNVVQRAIVSGVRVPDALVPIYTPFLLTYSFSPSRLLSIMDPILNLGILWRCLAAYCGIDFKTESEHFKLMLNLNQDAASPVTRAASAKSSASKRVVNNNSNNNASRAVSREPDDQLIKSSGVDQQKEDILEAESMTKNDEDEQQEIMASANKSRLLQLHAILGDSVFLIEKLRNNEMCSDLYMSPLLSDDAIISKFPRTCLIVSETTDHHIYRCAITLLY